MKSARQNRMARQQLIQAIVTNGDAKRLFLEVLHATALAPSTKRTRDSCVDHFFAFLADVPAWDMEPRDLQEYVLDHHSWCRNVVLRKGTTWDCNLAELAGKGCPGLTGGAWTECPSFVQRTRQSVDNHIDAMTHVYAWLVAQGKLPYNPALGLRKWWRQQKVKGKSGTQRNRIYTDDELRLIFRQPLSPNKRIILVVLLKTGMRISEFLHLTTDYLHLEEGWGEIPVFPGKRLNAEGERRFIIDAQLEQEFRRYLRWRSKVARPGAGVTLLVSQYGAAMLPPHCYKSIGPKWLDPFLEGLGINKPDLEKVGFHSFRHTATTAMRRGIDYAWVEVLRGCSPPGNMGTYHHPTLEDLRQQYAKAPPRIPF